MKKRCYVLIFIVIAIFIILTDVVFFERMLTRDILSMFVEDGMRCQTVNALLGTPTADIGSGAVVHEYAMPFGRRFLVVYGADCTAVNTVQPGPSYPLQGFLLPALLLMVAVFEIVLYISIEKRAKQ